MRIYLAASDKAKATSELRELAMTAEFTKNLLFSSYYEINHLESNLLSRWLNINP